MQNNNPLDTVFQHRKPIIIVFLSIVLLGFLMLGYKVIYDTLTMHVTAVQPKNNDKHYSTILPVIFTFNKEVAEVSPENVTISPDQTGTLSIVDGKKVQFIPEGEWKPNTKFTVTIDKVKAKGGKVSGKKSVTFTTQEVPYEQLQPKEQAQLREGSVSWEGEFPITKKLPHTTEGYRISYMNGVTDGRMTINIELYGIYNRPSQKAQYIADLTKHQEEAMQYLRDNGADFDKLNIVLDPDPALVQ